MNDTPWFFLLVAAITWALVIVALVKYILK